MSSFICKKAGQYPPETLMCCDTDGSCQVNSSSGFCSGVGPDKGDKGKKVEEFKCRKISNEIEACSRNRKDSDITAK